MESTMDNKYVTFKIDKEYYGINIESVTAIEKMENITRIPNSPKYIKGVINLRGNVITLISLRNKMNIQDKDTTIIRELLVISLS